VRGVSVDRYGAIRKPKGSEVAIMEQQYRSESFFDTWLL
jgi:hypothetical protein